MRGRVLIAALGVVALAALALGRNPRRRPEVPGVGRPTARPHAAAAEPATPGPALDPESIRDIFDFAEAPLPPTRRASGRAREAREGGLPPTPAGPRLVGLVSRAGRLVAALAADGEVELAGPGEKAAGVTVLAVDEEGVRVRRADGTEETLLLP
jgi:hypothetical protein